jgi:hypothetical protein
VVNDQDEEGYRRDWEESGAVGGALQNAGWEELRVMMEFPADVGHGFPQPTLGCAGGSGMHYVPEVVFL